MTLFATPVLRCIIALRYSPVLGIALECEWGDKTLCAQVLAACAELGQEAT